MVIDNRLATGITGHANDFSICAVAIRGNLTDCREAHLFLGDLAAVNTRAWRLDVQCAEHADAEVAAVGLGTERRAVAVDDEGALVRRVQLVGP